MTDRLQEIKALFSQGEAIWRKDARWLIAEVERLRAALDEAQLRSIRRATYWMEKDAPWIVDPLTPPRMICIKCKHLQPWHFNDCVFFAGTGSSPADPYTIQDAEDDGDMG